MITHVCDAGSWRADGSLRNIGGEKLPSGEGSQACGQAFTPPLAWCQTHLANSGRTCLRRGAVMASLQQTQFQVAISRNCQLMLLRMPNSIPLLIVTYTSLSPAMTNSGSEKKFGVASCIACQTSMNGCIPRLTTSLCRANIPSAPRAQSTWTSTQRIRHGPPGREQPLLAQKVRIVHSDNTTVQSEWSDPG